MAQSTLVCGYSFGDKGINSEIIEWLYGDRKNVIIPADPESPASMRRRIQKRDEWKTNGALKTLEIEDFS